MRALTALILLTAIAGLAIVSARQRQRAQLRDLDPTAVRPAGAGAPAPCTPFSTDNVIDASGTTWSYRLCGRGSDDRRVEIRFAGPGESSDSIEYRVWLSEPAQCDDSAQVRGRLLGIPGGGASMDSVSVPFGTYYGSIWVCARRARSEAGWRPREARHGDAP